MKNSIDCIFVAQNNWALIRWILCIWHSTKRGQVFSGATVPLNRLGRITKRPEIKLHERDIHYFAQRNLKTA